MLQYLAETFDLRKVKAVGVSSGAICLALLLKLEDGSPELGELDPANKPDKEEVHVGSGFRAKS